MERKSHYMRPNHFKIKEFSFATKLQPDSVTLEFSNLDYLI